MKSITVSELKNIIDSNGQKTAVVDTRAFSEYIDIRIEKTLSLPIDYINQSKIPWPRDCSIYVVSYRGQSAIDFCKKLDALGYHTFYLEGGLKAWCEQGYPVVGTLRKFYSFKSFLYIIRILLSPEIKRLSIRDLLIFHQIPLPKSLRVNTNSQPISNIKVKMRAPLRSLRSGLLVRIIQIAYFFRNTDINIRFVFRRNKKLFENSIIKTLKNHPSRNSITLSYPSDVLGITDHLESGIPHDYSYNLFSKLQINRSLQKQADEFISNNLPGDWVGVHYRGTDHVGTKAGWVVIENKEFMEADREAFITHLKKTINKHDRIFVASDQAQFIDQMHTAFPNRVYARDIKRSYNHRPLHNAFEHRGSKQIDNAVVDLLILAKSKLIYRIDFGKYALAVRYFNPSIKIISFEPGRDYPPP